MRTPPVSGDELVTAQEHGRICALAANGQRDLQRCVAERRDLFPAQPFDGALLANISMAIAFIAPWCTPEELRVANRATLWGFAVDWRIDHEAKSAEHVERVVASCLAVAEGADPDPDDPLAGLLADIRDELARAAAFGQVRREWCDELRRMLTAMAREWRWKAESDPARGDGLPTLDEYLANADNLGCTFVNLSHWIHTGEVRSAADIAALREAAAEVQRVVRLVNDLASYERDLRWGDLNAILCCGDRDEVRRRVTEHTERARRRFAPLRPERQRQAAYLERQIGFTAGFYGSTDFWGTR